MIGQMIAPAAQMMSLASCRPESRKRRFQMIDDTDQDPEWSRTFLHRKNPLFYRMLNGAEVGDLFMSLIHTCELNYANPFDYLTELQKHAEELAKNPAVWMPWNYRQTLPPVGTSEHPA